MDAQFYIGSGGFRGEISVIGGELTDFWVHPMMRGKGWGRALMKATLNWADRNGVRLRLRIHPFGKQNVHSSRRTLNFNGLAEFYSSYGFKRVNGVWMVRKVVV